MSRSLLLLFLFVGGAWADTISYDDNALFTISSSTIHFESPNNYVFNDFKNEIVLKVDQDGDIFLRDKWIGFDHRLSQKYRESREPRETAVPGTQGRP